MAPGPWSKSLSLLSFLFLEMMGVGLLSCRDIQFVINISCKPLNSSASKYTICKMLHNVYIIRKKDSFLNNKVCECIKNEIIYSPAYHK